MYVGNSWDDMVWTQKNGHTLLIKNMTDLHLQNTRKMFERSKNTHYPEYKRIVEEMESRANA